jgi:PAS domain S-box-containing protein
VPKPEIAKDESKERYQAFIQNSSEGIWRFEVEEPIPTSLPPDQQIKLMYKHAYLAETNVATAKMYGYRSVKPLMGMRLSDFLVESDPRNKQYLEAFIAANYNLTQVESHERDKNGKDKYFLNSLIGIIEDGHLVRAWGTQQDVTEQKAAADALQLSEERLQLAIRASSLGLWEWDVGSDELYWSPELRKIYNIDLREPVTFEMYMGMVHPDDREHASEMAGKSMQTGETYQFEHRIVHRNGETHWLLGTGRTFLENGKPVRMIGTSMNIDAIKQAQELQTANTMLKTERAELLALNRAKDEFIALASHQLRTPATAVKQYISLLMNDIVGPVSDDQYQYLQIAFNSNERQLRIINDLLKTAQIDSSLFTLKKKKQDIVDVIRAAMSELEDTIEYRDQTIDLKGLDKAPLDIDADEMKLVFINLLENASKYSYPKTTITINVRKKGPKHLEITVKDQGVGINKQDRARIFDKFTRVDNDLSDTVTGTGLGLYWVERIVELHDGAISVESERGKGSTFRICLPL